MAWIKTSKRDMEVTLLYSLEGLWVLVLHQKTKNVLLGAHVSGVPTAPVAAAYALYLGLDFTPTLNVLPKYTYMDGAPDRVACSGLHYPAGPAVCSRTTCFFFDSPF